MITVKTVLAPSAKISERKKVKNAKPSYSVDITPTEKGIDITASAGLNFEVSKAVVETATYSTIIVVDGKYISLSITKHLGYQKPYQLNHSIAPPKGTNLFEDIFYWPIEVYTNPGLNHLAYKRMVETEFHYQSKLLYEIQWEVISVKIENNIIVLSNKERSHMVAIPSNDSTEPRYDYITDDCHYKYNCKPGEYKNRGIEIIVNKK